MIRITVLPFKKTIEVETGAETLREIMAGAGLPFESPCGGQGVCGECRIRVQDPADVPPTPHETISDEEEQAGVRLACCLIPETDMIIEVLSVAADDSDCVILEGEHFEDGGAVQKEVVCAPVVSVSQKPAGYSMTYGDLPPLRLDVWEDGFSPKGLAVDIGTTTIVVSLMCLTSGRELATASALNPQIKMGHDIMSRIQQGSTPAGLTELADAVNQRISRLVKDLCQEANADSREILDMVVGGNTAMLQLAAKIDPEPLGRVPFTVGIDAGRDYPVNLFAVKGLNPSARVYVPPVAHAFVGSDITAGILVCHDFFDPAARVLFVDIGTNGELAMNLGERTLTTSTAAGPAFEGMGISSGMRAGIGAVEAVETDGETLRLITIGDAPVKGICGSGMLDLTACLLALGVLEKSGRMRRADEADRLPQAVTDCLCEVDDMPAFEYAPEIYFTQKDVRQVQLAKSPVRTAIDIFIQEAGGDIDQIILSGGFGHTLRPESLVQVGLLPENLADKVSFLGNTSLLGCHRLLTEAACRKFIEDTMNQTTYLSLAERSDFMEAFIENSEFPRLETSEPLKT